MEIFNKLKLNPHNPRTIGKGQFQRLKTSLQEFPKMLELRPIVYDKDFVVLGGNMRLRALQELVGQGFEIKDSYFKSANDLTEEEKRRFIIKDNVSDGSWDDELLANEWADLPLKDWGVDFVPPEPETEGDILFTEELLEEHNIIVLYFDNEVDWLQAQTLYPLPTVKALDAKENYKRQGVGRIVKGIDFINKIRK